MTEPTEVDLNVAGLVLAGGRSSRFGDADANKAIATLGTRTLLGHVVDAVTLATRRPPVVAVRTADQRETYADVLAPRDVSFAFDDATLEGPLAGVIGAADAVDAPWLFCCACDMPLVSPAAIRWLVDTLRNRICVPDTPLAALAIRHSDGTVDPLHTLYRRSAITSVREELPGTAGPRTLLESLDHVATVAVEAVPDRVPIEESTTNVNTWDDLETVSGRPTTIQ